MESPREALLARLGLSGELPHLEEALTHPSFSNEQRKGACADNQRLEFLGDAVLGLCVAELLMQRFPGADEGELSRMRASLVNPNPLAAWARTVELGAALRLGRGAQAAGERDRTNVLADAVEAMMGAIYLDRGFDAARLFVHAVIAEPLARLTEGPERTRDPKSELQERVQATGGPSPRYRVVRVEGPPHHRDFTVVVEIDERVVGEGQGRSKKLAEQEAARAAILRLWAGDADAASEVSSGSNESEVRPSNGALPRTEDA
ncbi:ribonuclease III [Polyangium sp. 15x6]|uniref:ribonuclease III n=1 Tax=Polyangium sp. 15x6 TaxID=3042687 RepID=UPI00249B346C|nr:ribonuclease III [Polyangium sp. 15x6]MDI3283193.1 ribonuclease III [Polyangium sp. 15x6]